MNPRIKSPEDITLKSATEQLHLLRTGQLSIPELAEAHIDQINRLNPALNAFADFNPERVRAQAQALHEQAVSSNKQTVGALHGLPVTVKSSISTANYLCETGSLINRGHIPFEDAPVVARLRAAGALILGTTNCPEFLMAYETANLLHGRTSNPWDHTRSPGGSSGGEAAAIASGMSAAGLGSDSGGSVRQPAHFTGICALKPTPGRIPGRGHLPPCIGPFGVLGAIGPMARTIADVTLLFKTLAGHDPLDPLSPPDRPAPTPLTPSQTTIAYFEDDAQIPVTPETRQAIRDAVTALRASGYRVEPFRPRTLELLRQLWLKFFMQCGAIFYQPTIRGKHSQLSPIFQEFLSLAKARGSLTTTDLLFAWAELDTLRSHTLHELQPYPILLCPVASIPAFRHNERQWTIDDQPVDYLDAMRHTQWFNVLAAPAAVVPVGHSPAGLPIGVQVIAHPHHDEQALAVAAVLDQNFGYHPPPMSLPQSPSPKAPPKEKHPPKSCPR